MGLSFVRDCNLFSFSSLNCSAIRRDNCLGVRKWPYFLSMQYFGFAEVLIRHCSDIANVTYNLIPFTLRWHFVTESLTLQILNQLFFKFLTLCYLKVVDSLYRPSPDSKLPCIVIPLRFLIQGHRAINWFHYHCFYKHMSLNTTFYMSK